MIQARYNQEHNITPETVRSSIKNILQTVYDEDYVTVELEAAEEGRVYFNLQDIRKDIKKMDTFIHFGIAAGLVG